jgi:hypothetical protein
MSTDVPFQPRPAEYKTSMDGLGGLVRVPLVGGLHAGRELFIDEPEVPTEIFTTPRREPFEWWPATLRDEMAATSLGSDPSAPPIRYVLRVSDGTREPRFVAETDPDWRWPSSDADGEPGPRRWLLVATRRAFASWPKSRTKSPATPGC